MKNMKLLFLIVFILFALDVHAEEKHKVLYYRNPMNPAITSPTFMKDSMGMDYIPVYADEEGAESGTKEEAVVKIKDLQQKIIGVETEALQSRSLMRMIRTVAKIAYDPELYVAQEEYLQALRMVDQTKESTLGSVNEQAVSLLSAAEKKLLLLGMNKVQIEELAKREKPQSNLYLPLGGDSVWAYLTIYEYDLGTVNLGDHVVLRAIAYPEEEFSGKIVSLDPVLDMNTRSIRARVQVDNPQGKLKPNMYADALIHIDLGERLALPKEAVLDTGMRKIVYVDLGQGKFAAREVELGQEAIALVDNTEHKFFPVLKGLNAGDIVVTNGNFLIDSQSQLTGGMSALWGAATEIKQEEDAKETPKTQHRH